MKILKMREWFIVLFIFLNLICLIFYYFYSYQFYIKGVSYIKQGMYEEAKREFIQYLAENPYSYTARLNLALVDFFLEDYKNAKGEYQVVFEDSPRSKERFYAYFNAAHIHTREGELDNTLDAYQSALGEKPDSIESKINIELLMIQAKSSQEKKEDRGDSPPNTDEQDPTQNQTSKDKTKEAKNENEKDKLEELGKDKNIDDKQMQFILEELEKREQKVRKKIEQKYKNDQNKDKDW